MNRGPVIIIEGPDGAGKTRLARTLQQWWTHDMRRGSIAYLHQGPYKRDPLPETIRLLERREHRGAVIADRLHLGEQVYGPIYRNRDALGDAGRRMLERYLLARGAAVILARPPFIVAHRNWALRRATGGEMFADQYAEVYHAFEKVKTFLPRREYDYAADSFEGLAKWLVLVLAAPWARRTLIVGEAPGSNQIVGAPPFCARGGCSEWLAEQLDEARIDERRLAWVNAQNARGRPTRPAIIRELAAAGQLGPVIALGRVADAWARRYVAPVTTVVHPQFHKRFHHHDPYPLLEALRHAAH